MPNNVDGGEFFFVYKIICSLQFAPSDINLNVRGHAKSNSVLNCATQEASEPSDCVDANCVAMTAAQPKWKMFV